jgi:hypothetical protein
VLELTLLGQHDQFITDQQRADAEVLERTLERYSLEPMADRVEQFVVWPQVPVVGRYDCILGYKGAPALFDLKSGRSAVDYPHSTITQLALYAYAPQTSKTIEHKGDRWTCEEWTTMPDGLDLETAYVILVGDDDEVGTLYALDLKHGYRAALAALEIVQWRREHDYGQALARKILPDRSPAVAATGDAPCVVAVATQGAQTPDARKCRTCGASIWWVITENGKRMPLDTKATPGGNIHLYDGTAYVLDVKGQAIVEHRGNGDPLYTSHFATCPQADAHRKRAPDERRQALRERYNGLCDDDRARFRALAIPPSDLDRVEAGLDSVDPFMIRLDPVPATPITPTTPPAKPDEGDEVPDSDYAELEARYHVLGPAEQMWMSALVIGADANLQRRRSRRRYHLYVALLILAEHGYADPDHDEHVRSLVWEASGRDDAVLFANVTVGKAMGSLDVDRAQALATLVLSLVLGSLHFLTDPETRRLQLVGA